MAKKSKRERQKRERIERDMPRYPEPLTTDYRYGGVGDIDREDLPVPSGWEKGR